jgi:hypothetical protein
MKIHSIATIFLTIAMCLPGAGQSSDRLVEFDFAKKNSLDFLEYLKKIPITPIYSFEQPLVDWVKEEHIPALVALLDSQEKSMSVSLMASSHLRIKSTVGDEAAFLIAGYRAGKYPPGLNSRKLTQAEKNEIREWWKNFSRERARAGMNSG